MKNKLDHIFNTVVQIEPPQHLKEAVLAKIFLAQQRKLKRKKILFAFAFAMSGISIFAAAFIFGNQLMSSEFWSIGMLSFTDMGTLAGHWQEFGLSLLETFPALSVAGILLPVFVFMLLLKEYAQYAQQQITSQFKLKMFNF